MGRGMLQDWVSNQASHRPDAGAVVDVDEQSVLTYGELEEVSDRIATVLQHYGCVRGDRVAVLMPSSPRAISSLVGVLKAGCAYVPIEPAGPIERTADMIRQCEPRVVLVGGEDPDVIERLLAIGAVAPGSIGWLGASPPPKGADFDYEDVVAASALSASAQWSPDDLAYILFTSGTTGTPKGVPITHRNVDAFIRWAVAYFELGPEDRLSGHTALTFDLSTFDIYATLAAGAQLHLVPKRVRMIPHDVAAFIGRAGLTLWFSVPSQLAYVARFDALAGELSTLRHVVWCGDVLSSPTLLYWKHRIPGAAFTNLYGPTETTVASSYYRVPDDFDDPTVDVPIGVACDGEELLVLDERLLPVPDGEAGDLYIGGVGMSRGYWRDPERTASAFVMRPSSSSGGSRRVYRTGDRGMRGPSGAVRFLGRSDFQIKTAGYRVEPAEVESAILRLEDVAACAVVPIQGDEFSGSVIGCAYVPTVGTEPRASEIKQRLRRLLPTYMIPTKWLAVEQLPLDGRGKVDRVRTQSLLGNGESSPKVEHMVNPT